MNRILKKLPGTIVAALAVSLALGACKKKEDDSTRDFALLALLTPSCSLSSLGGDITSSCSVGGDGVTVSLTAPAYVKNGVTLTVLPGTTVRAEAATYIFVEQGGKLVANGTAAKPIVLTSSKAAGSRAPGDWGGIIMVGKAPTSATGGTAQNTEGLDPHTYGTDNDSADSSGSLKYVRIEFAGYQVASGNEFNGLSMYAVGSGTTLDHIQVHFGLDDNFEAWGGTWNGTYLVSTGYGDDGFDLDFGFKGSVNKLIVYSYPAGTGMTQGIASQDPRGFEVDGAGKASAGHVLTGYSSFEIKYFTNIGDPTATANGLKVAGFRDCVDARLSNGVFLNFPAAYATDANNGDCKASDAGGREPSVTWSNVSIEGGALTHSNGGTAVLATTGSVTTGVSQATYVTALWSAGAPSTAPVFVTNVANSAFEGEASDWTAGWTNWVNN